MVKDITEQKRAEAALRESEAQLHDLAARMAKIMEEERKGLEVKVTAEQPTRRFAPDADITLFRIAQEAMLNVVKHARAEKISIHLKSNGAPVRMTIADNGAGFDPAAAERPDDGCGWGLISMRERAQSVGGNIRIESSPGKGTKVIVLVPCC